MLIQIQFICSAFFGARGDINYMSAFSGKRVDSQAETRPLRKTFLGTIENTFSIGALQNG